MSLYCIWYCVYCIVLICFCIVWYCIVLWYLIMYWLYWLILHRMLMPNHLDSCLPSLQNESCLTAMDLHGEWEDRMHFSMTQMWWRDSEWPAWCADHPNPTSRNCGCHGKRIPPHWSMSAIFGMYSCLCPAFPPSLPWLNQRTDVNAVWWDSWLPCRRHGVSLESKHGPIHAEIWRSGDKHRCEWMQSCPASSMGARAQTSSDLHGSTETCAGWGKHQAQMLVCKCYAHPLSCCSASCIWLVFHHSHNARSSADACWPWWTLQPHNAGIPSMRKQPGACSPLPSCWDMLQCCWTCIWVHRRTLVACSNCECS